MSAFAIESAFIGHSYELRLSGAVDLLVTDTVIEAALARIADPAVPRLVIDLRAVTFLDSTGLGALVTIRNATVAMDKEIALRNVPRRVQRLLAITGLDQVFATSTEGAPNPEAPSVGRTPASPMMG